ncbi:MAG: hypothetical protein QNJ00_04485 [Woeseiaceae bacterium]|nr:hypothetical protein [Woeseiaceae bacterium]
MTSDNLNKWLTLGANLAVFVGIVLVIVELQQNREMIRAQTRSEISAGITVLLSDVANNPQLASLVRRADDGEPLTPDEEKQYGHRSAALFRYFENVHYQYRQGMYDEAEYLAHREAWRQFFQNSKTAVKNWCDFREIVSAELAAEIDGLIDENPCLER